MKPITLNMQHFAKLNIVNTLLLSKAELKQVDEINIQIR